MARRLESDKLLFVSVVVLVLFGTLMVFSASAVMASQLYGNSYYFLFRQLAWVGAGLVLMVGMMNLDYRRLASPRSTKMRLHSKPLGRERIKWRRRFARSSDAWHLAVRRRDFSRLFPEEKQIACA